MILYRTTILTLTTLVAGLAGCSPFMVSPPHTGRASLTAPLPNQPADFLIHSVDLIDRRRPIGRVGDTWWGGQYQVVLSDSLKDYFETEVAGGLRSAGFKVNRHPGDFAARRLNLPRPAVRLKLELQELTLYRHPNPNLWGDEVVGICKIRGMVYSIDSKLLYQRQFVGKVDTYRPIEELVPPGIGLISRRGLGILLEKLLVFTIRDFTKTGLPEVGTVLKEFREGGGKMPDTPNGNGDTKKPDNGGDDGFEFPDL
jgi:hypothetical protein